MQTSLASPPVACSRNTQQQQTFLFELDCYSKTLCGGHALANLGVNTLSLVILAMQITPKHYNRKKQFVLLVLLIKETCMHEFSFHESLLFVLYETVCYRMFILLFIPLWDSEWVKMRYFGLNLRWLSSGLRETDCINQMRRNDTVYAEKCS